MDIMSIIALALAKRGGGGGGGAVNSVNEQTGDVVLDAEDVGAQSTDNLVTTLSASSTDTQYPSAKCVYDLVGDIETLLAAI